MWWVAGVEEGAQCRDHSCCCGVLKTLKAYQVYGMGCFAAEGNDGMTAEREGLNLSRMGRGRRTRLSD